VKELIAKIGSAHRDILPIGSLDIYYPYRQFPTPLLAFLYLGYDLEMTKTMFVPDITLLRTNVYVSIFFS
jgi:hypothetical protein